MAQQTVKQMLPAIGASVLVRFETIQVACIVKDVKNTYGRVRLQVAPYAGDGCQWVELERITPMETRTDWTYINAVLAEVR